MGISITSNVKHHKGNSEAVEIIPLALKDEYSSLKFIPANVGEQKPLKLVPAEICSFKVLIKILIKY